MRAKTLILLFVALGCGMIAAVAVSKAVMDKGGDQPAEAMVEIFVAVKDLPHAEKISAETVKLEKWPKVRLPEGAIFDLAQLENKFTKQNIFAGEPILERKVSDSRESFSTTIPSGFRIFNIPSNSSYVKPGDHVDILGTFKSGGRSSVPETRTVMRNVKVHGINGSTTRESEDGEGGPKVSKNTTFQLLVKESQLEALSLANSMGELEMHLRPLGEDNTIQDDGRGFLEWMEGQHEPETAAFVSNDSSPFGSLASVEPEDEPKNQMVIVTPTSMRTYEWSKPDEMPREVAVEGEAGFGQMPAQQYDSPSSNVYSGIGGYEPTYPTSVNPLAPVTGGGAPTNTNINATTVD